MLDSLILQLIALLVEQLNQTLRILNGQLNRINIRAGGLAGVGIGLIVGLVGVVQDQSGAGDFPWLYSWLSFLSGRIYLSPRKRKISRSYQ